MCAVRAELCGVDASGFYAQRKVFVCATGRVCVYNGTRCVHNGMGPSAHHEDACAQREAPREQREGSFEHWEGLVCTTRGVVCTTGGVRLHFGGILVHNGRRCVHNERRRVHNERRRVHNERRVVNNLAENMLRGCIRSFQALGESWFSLKSIPFQSGKDVRAGGVLAIDFGLEIGIGLCMIETLVRARTTRTHSYLA